MYMNVSVNIHVPVIWMLNESRPVIAHCQYSFAHGQKVVLQFVSSRGLW